MLRHQRETCRGHPVHTRLYQQLSMLTISSVKWAKASVLLLLSRDDVIFLIYLYQRWIYRVDMTRVNEFGFSGQQAEERDAAAAVDAAQAGNAAEPTAALEVRGLYCGCSACANCGC